MFQNERIQGRLTKSFLMVALIGAIASVIGVIMLIVVSTQYESALVNYGFSQGDIGKALVTFSETRSAARGIIGYNSEELIAKMEDNHDTAKDAFETYWKKAEETVASDQERVLYDSVESKLDAYWEAEEKVMAIGRSTDNEKSIQAQTMMGDEVSPLYDEIYEEMMELLNANVDQGNSLSDTLNFMSWLFIGVIIVIIVLAVVISSKMGMSIAKGIAGPLGQLEDRLKTFAQGNLHDPFPTVTSDDEVASMIKVAGEMADTLNVVIDDTGLMMEHLAAGNYAIRTDKADRYVGDFNKLLLNLRAMRDNMVATVIAIKEASSQVSAGASNLAESSQSMAEGATEQAGAAEELQATITSITENINKAATEALAGYEQAQKYADEAQRSSQEMQLMVETMKRIDETSKKIGNIISEIEDIASQTNLLSLNASIEAARAGEAGRGFAVVADQIRQLAEQTTKSAVDTRELIEGSIQEVQDGNRAVERVSTTILEVVDGIAKIAQSSKSISDVAKGQADAMNQADEGVNQISQVIQSNSASAEESSATSEELSAQATTLDDLVNKYRLP